MPEEIKLIQPAPVVRDEYGMFEHPDLPDFDEGDGEKCKAWIAQQGLQLIMFHLETDAPEEIADRYFASDEPHCGYWEPSKPEGEGWFCLAIHDTEDGPVCWWGRREAEQAWSVNGDDGSWDYPNLAALIRDNFGSALDGTSFGPGLGNGLKVGDTVHSGVVCKEDPASFLPDAEELLNHMFEAASGSDAGEWVDNYPDIDDEAKAALEQAMKPLQDWARQFCQPNFFTIEKMGLHTVTEADVRLARASEAQP